MKKLFIGLTIITAVSLFAQPVFAFTTSGTGGMVKGSTASLKNTKDSSSLSAGPSLPLSQSTDTSKIAPSLNAQSLSIDSSTYVQGEILVKYKNNRINLQTVSGRATASNFIRSKSLEKMEDLRKSNISILRIKDAKTVEQKVAELKNDPNVEYVEPNYKRYPSDINTNDTSKGLLWGLDNTGQSVNGVSGISNADINAPEAWAISEATTSASVIVAIIDSGVAYNHPDLAANMWDGTNCKDENGIAIAGGCNHGYDYEDGDNTPLPTTSSHGTHIAGTIAAVKGNGLGIIGVAPRAKIMAIKYNSTVFEEVKSIDFAIQNGAQVINASFTGATFSQSEFDAINRFKTSGGIFIAAAGNGTNNNGIPVNNDLTPFYPCNYNLSDIICVAATDQNDSLATFSNYGATSVSVGAPGTNIYSTGFTQELFTNATPPSFTNTLFTKTSGGWKTGTWADVGGDVNDRNAEANSSYVNNDDGVLTLTTPQDTTVHGGNVILSFSLYAKIEPPIGSTCFDYLLIQTDNNDNNWVTKTVACGDYSLFPATLDLGVGTSNMRVRFVWHTDSSVVGLQVPIVDDITISNTNSYQYMDGTSMAAPHVAGLAALIEGYNPSLTSSQVKNAILTTGDSVASLSGNTVSGKRINAQKALQAINPAKAITTFSIPSQVGTTTINESAHTIAVTVPFGTSVTALVPTIVITGASVSPLSGVAQDFTSPVTYTVTAADGSTQTYSVTVTVAFPTSHTISGTVKYYDGVKVIPGAIVTLSDASTTVAIATTTTSAIGTYQFTGATDGGNYVIKISKSDNASGLSSADQIKIGRHIVGLELFSTIYKTIAGDVNDSGGLSSADQIKIGRFVVGLDSSLLSGAWKFYSSAVVPTVANYRAVGLSRTLTNLATDTPNQDFVGVKMGDVNNSWVSN